MFLNIAKVGIAAIVVATLTVGRMMYTFEQTVKTVEQIKTTSDSNTKAIIQITTLLNAMEKRVDTNEKDIRDKK